MLNDELGMQLHDRETTGEELNTQEKLQLEAWYAQNDAAETAMLEAAQVPAIPNSERFCAIPAISQNIKNRKPQSL